MTDNYDVKELDLSTVDKIPAGKGFIFGSAPNSEYKKNPPPKKASVLNTNYKLERTISIGFLQTTLTSVSFL